MKTGNGLLLIDECNTSENQDQLLSSYEYNKKAKIKGKTSDSVSSMNRRGNIVYLLLFCALVCSTTIGK